MKLEEIAKMAIDEVAMELKQIGADAREGFEPSKATNGVNLTLNDDVKSTNAAGSANLIGRGGASDEANTAKSALNDASNFQITSQVVENENVATPQKAFEVEVANFTGEEIFLKNLKERVLVLFEGLNATNEENLQDRLSLTLKFLEFVLANVENRLENLQK